jgi:hypothetical protein
MHFFKIKSPVLLFYKRLGQVRNVSRIAVVILLVVISISCKPRRGGFYLDVIGNDFADARVSIDGKPVGALRPVITETTTDIMDTTDSDPKKKTQFTSGSLDYVSVEPGDRRILLETAGGKRLEILAQVEAGENYVAYLSESKILSWNDDCFEVAPGKVTRLNRQNLVSCSLFDPKKTSN